jgi:hypothetical protein
LLKKAKSQINKEFEGDNKENRCKVLETRSRKTLYFFGFYLVSKYKKLLDILELLTP